MTILTNGPGELWGWVRPVAMELRRRGHSVSLWLLPCQFASGHEREAASLLGVDKLEGPAGAARLWHAMTEEKTDRVLQMGGDTAFGFHLAKAAKAPLFCYTYGPKKGLENKKNACQTFTAFPSQSLLIPGSRAIGDLVQDALSMDIRAGHGRTEEQPGAFSGQEREPEAPRVLFLPGSRPEIRKAALSWLSIIKNELENNLPCIRVRTLFPPFVPDSELAAWREARLNPVKTGAGIAMRDADLALTQPGTNTLELMHCGLPALVTAPLGFLELIPVAGLRGMLASLPVLGRRFRLAALKRIIKRWGGFISLPNRIAGRSVMDELYGDVSPQQIALRMTELLRDSGGLREKRAALLALSERESRPGASGRLCDLLLGLASCPAS